MINEIIIRATDGPFPVDEVIAYLAGVRYAVWDERDPSMFMVFEHVEIARSELQARRRRDGFPYTGLVCVAPEQIEISHFGGAVAASLRELVLWLRARHRLRFLDEQLTDVTTQIDDKLAVIFEASPW